MSLLVSARSMRRLEYSEQALHRTLSSVRRMEVIGTPGTGNAAAILASRLATVLASVRQGRVMHRTPDWSRYQALGPEVLSHLPPALAPLLRQSGPVWVGAHDTDDSCFDITIGASMARMATELGSFTIRRNVLCLVVPSVRSQADRFIAAANYLSHIGHRTVVVFVTIKSGANAAQDSSKWARVVAPRLEMPTMILHRNDLVMRNRPAPRGVALRLMRLAAALMSDDHTGWQGGDHGGWQGEEQ